MEALLLALTITQYVAMVTANQNICPAVRYSGSFKADNHVSDHALLGHSYKNVTTSNIKECFNICVMDCACVSYQLFGKRCELLDGDRHTAPIDFKRKTGYKYYELKQRISLPQNAPSVCTGHCRNGCCSFVTCLNGGTCIEQCDDVKRKFQCLCIPGIFTGRMCEKPMTCAAHGKGLVSGLYPITLPSGNKMNVYCDFHSQPGFVWTLIESFAFANMLKYQAKSFTTDFPVNQTGTFNWTDYRLSRLVMLHIRSNSTLFRATCKYETDGLLTRDYIRGLLTNFDIIMHASGTICAHVQYINVRGINCSECTTHCYQGPYHAFVDSGLGSIEGCQWDGRQGSQRLWSNKLNRYMYDDNFGFYSIHNQEHRCSSSHSSTTQWWLGNPEYSPNN
ncbi:uncharacterized protein LOC116302717 [Actinia tenebrosa]|uniref:Uncharacterized protein LOC116302717 n=1 Tax=Actinia tenebrosa TaxID=6105 RepID=A0A6P8IM75_ACTTE|nr:uncharacterized protein LOC116302717 [Actinia tenebrosa]XP_031567939.1 uncharacterized protein LOC116302717 [Actinia tenebrosa]